MQVPATVSVMSKSPLVLLNLFGFVINLFFLFFLPGLSIINIIGAGASGVGLGIGYAINRREIEALNAARKPKAIGASDPTEGMSWQAKRVYSEWMKLPEEARFGGDDILPSLRALDVKYADVIHHFSYYDRHSYSFGPIYSFSRCSCKYNKYRERVIGKVCKVMPEYEAMFKEFAGITQAYQERERALAVASVSGDLDRVQEIIARARSEREIVESVTKELT